MNPGGFHLIPEAIKDLLAAQTFSQKLVWERRTQVYVQTEKATTLKGIVAPFEKQVTSGTRVKPLYVYRVGVFVVQLLAGFDVTARQAREDELMTVTEEIELFLFAQRAVDVDGEKLSIARTDTAVLPVDLAGLREHKTFVGLVEFNVQA